MPSMFVRVIFLQTCADAEFADVETIIQWKNGVKFMYLYLVPGKQT
jgi:hypothetical protein